MKSDRPIVETFSEVGEFQRLLSSGSDAAYPVPAKFANVLVALDMGARRAQILKAGIDDPNLESQLLQQLTAMRAHLTTVGFTLMPERDALPSVIRDIRANPGQQVRNKGKGGPLVLFESWIEIGEVMGASDLHVEVRRNVCHVRARVDGLLEPLADGGDGRYSRKDGEDAIAAGYNSSRTGNSGSQYEANEFVDCMIRFNTTHASGQLRFQNLPGRLGPKAVIRFLRSEREESSAS